MLVSRDFVHYENQLLTLVQFIKYVTGIMWLHVYDVSKCKTLHVHVCEQALWTLSVGNSTIENVCIIVNSLFLLGICFSSLQLWTMKVYDQRTENWKDPFHWLLPERQSNVRQFSTERLQGWRVGENTQQPCMGLHFSHATGAKPRNLLWSQMHWTPLPSPLIHRSRTHAWWLPLQAGHHSQPLLPPSSVPDEPNIQSYCHRFCQKDTAT